MYKVHYDSEGVLKGFYSGSVVYDSVPEPNIDITQDRWAEVSVDPNKFVVVGGELVEKTFTNDELVARAKNQVLDELSYYYKSDEVRTISYNNHVVKLSDKSLAGTDGKRTRLKDNGERVNDTWYYDDGSTEVLDLAGFTALNNLLWDSDQNLRDIRQAHKEAIQALTTVEEIEAYDFKADINGLSWV